MRWLAALAVAGVLFLGSMARADDAIVTVLVLVSPGGDALASRVEAELRALGFAVTIAKDDGTNVELEGAARRAGAAAAIRVVRSDAGAQVWVADRMTGKTLLRNVDVDPGDDRESVLAVRSVELLRASLLEIETTLPPRGDVVAPPAVVERVVAPARAQRFAIGVGLGPQVSSTVAPGFHGYASAAWLPSRLGLEVTALVPVAPAQVCRPEGCAEISSGLVGGGARLLVLPERSRVRPELALGFAAAIVHATGQAQLPFAGVGANAIAAAVYGRVTLAFVLTRSLRLGLDMLGGAALPPPAIRFAGTEIGRWGGPFASLLVHGEVGF